MFGDANEASIRGQDLTSMTAAERAVSFHHKSLRQRAAVVAAGPLANFLFAMVVMAGLFMIEGHPFPPAVVGSVEPGSAVEDAGILAGDRTEAIDGQAVDRVAA